MSEFKEIINSINDVNEKKEPKCAVSVNEYILDSANKLNSKREYCFTSPSVNFIVNSDYIIIDLIFPITGLIELRTAWNYLKKFGEKQTELMDDEDAPILEFTILPIEFKGQYLCTLINPIYWSLQSSDPGVKTNNTIRMLFEKDGVLIHEGEKLNDQEIEREINDELREEERLEEYMRQKQEAHEAELEKEEEMRRKHLQI